jgi:hypothetical protein
MLDGEAKRAWDAGRVAGIPGWRLGGNAGALHAAAAPREAGHSCDGEPVSGGVREPRAQRACVRQSADGHCDRCARQLELGRVEPREPPLVLPSLAH